MISQWSLSTPQTVIPRMMFTPGVSRGTMIWVMRPLVSLPPSLSSVRHMTMKKSAFLPFDVNHLWPLMTHSSPSRRAVVLSERGSEPGWSGSVIEKPDSNVPSISGSSHLRFCSSVPYFTRIVWLPELGATTPNSDAAPIAYASTSFMYANSRKSRPAPPYSTGRCGAHKPACFTTALMCSRSSRACSTSPGVRCAFMYRAHNRFSFGRIS